MLFGIFDRLRARFPNVVFENCAGGGGRTDLGMMARFHTTWISDWMRAPRAVQILNGVTLTLPPEVCSRAFALVGGPTASAGSLETQLRVPLFGLEYAAPDAARGYAGLFRLNPVGSPVFEFRPRGLSRARRYRVVFENEGAVVERTGDDLARNGFPVRLERPLTSELVLFEAV